MFFSDDERKKSVDLAAVSGGLLLLGLLGVAGRSFFLWLFGG
jgi:hypothetical protein